jgi:hypothetical protein
MQGFDVLQEFWPIEIALKRAELQVMINHHFAVFIQHDPFELRGL